MCLLLAFVRDTAVSLYSQTPSRIQNGNHCDGLWEPLDIFDGKRCGGAKGEIMASAKHEPEEEKQDANICLLVWQNMNVWPSWRAQRFS